MTSAKVEEWFIGVDCVSPNNMHLWARQLDRCDQYYIAFGVPVGGECDPTDQEGTAHFLEHVAFRGGNRFANNLSIRDHLTPWINFPRAYTARQFTRFEISVPPELLFRALEVMPTLLFDIGFNGVELERSIIQQEMLNRLNQVSQVTHEATESILTGHPAWRHMVIGTPDSIARISSDDLRQFHQQWYTAGNTYAVIVGPRSEDLMLEALIKAVEWIPQGVSRVAELPQPPTITPGVSSDHYWREWNANFTTGVVAYSVHLPSDPHQKILAKLIAKILNDGRGSPLFQALREEAGLVYSWELELDSYRSFDQLRFTASVQPNRMNCLRKAFKDTIQDERHYTFASRKVARHKMSHEIRTSHPSEKEIGCTRLEAMLELRNAPHLNEELEGLARISLDEMMEFVRNFLHPDKWRVVQILPND